MIKSDRELLPVAIKPTGTPALQVTVFFTVRKEFSRDAVRFFYSSLAGMQISRGSSDRCISVGIQRYRCYLMPFFPNFFKSFW